MKKEHLLDINTLFIGKIIPENLYDEVIENIINSMPHAADVHQKSIIKGLEANLVNPVNIFNFLPVFSYPKYYSKSFIKSKWFEHSKGAIDYSVCFLNVKYIKNIFFNILYKNQFRKYLNLLQSTKQIDSVIIYSADERMLRLVKLLKRKYIDLPITIILPDLPEYISLGEESFFVKLRKKIISNNTYNVFKQIDQFIVLTSQTVDLIDEDKPTTVVEGSVDLEKFKRMKRSIDPKLRKIVYTGTTHQQFGIKRLLDAFTQIKDENYRLIICGSGDSDAVIDDYASNDSRISFLGSVSNARALAVQHSATVLINPRQNIGDYVKYSFPSKTLEYLATGVPVIGYKLEGIPKEYDDFLLYVHDNTTQALKEKIVEICSLSIQDNIKLGEKGKEFVFEFKNTTIQGKKIVDALI